MPIYTTIESYPMDNLPDVYDYSENNELMRQVLINGVWVESPDPELNAMFAGLDIIYKEAAIAFARQKSSEYNGGLWEFNEHGLLSLSTSQEKMECDCSNYSIQATAEEFAFAMSIFAANYIVSCDKYPPHIVSYFTYIYHLAHCTLNNAKNSETFDKSNVNSIID